ncbi:MAG: ATP-binding protein [Elusimicrobiota bacterium]
MSIRKKLILAFSGLVAGIVIIAGILFWLGQKGNEYLSTALRAYSEMVTVREIQFSIDKQWKSFNFYLILGETEELNNFNEFNNTVQVKFNEWQLLARDNRDVEAIAKVKLCYNDFYSMATNIIGIYKQGKRELVLVMVDTELMKLSDHVIKEVKSLVEEKNQALQKSQQKMAGLGRMSVTVSIITSIISLVWSMIMSLYIFRSIADPLLVLRTGAKLIGEGNLDHKIVIKSKDEIGELAEAFNGMVDSLKTLQLQVIQMDRMSSLGQLAGGVAHELNNPLTGVLGQCQLMLEKVPPENPMHASLEKVERAAQRCRTIVRALLDFARQKDYIFVETDVHGLIDESLGFCQSDLTSAKVVVKKNYGLNLPKPKISSTHVQQVFLNLITNAAQAIANVGGGVLTITTMVIDKIEDNGQRKKFVVVSFRDDGIGIKKENINHIFDPFFTTKDIGKGTGLGLTVSYGIIQRHNGEILAASNGERQGSEFRVMLPC